MLHCVSPPLFSAVFPKLRHILSVDDWETNSSSVRVALEDVSSLPKIGYRTEHIKLTVTPVCKPLPVTLSRLKSNAQVFQLPSSCRDSYHYHAAPQL